MVTCVKRRLPAVLALNAHIETTLAHVRFEEAKRTWPMYESSEFRTVSQLRQRSRADEDAGRLFFFLRLDLQLLLHRRLRLHHLLR
jgi:hypothetical protein